IKISSFLKDINSTKDVSTYLNYVRINKGFKSLLKLLFKTANKKRNLISENIQAFFFAFHHILRGPPSLS
ncbi:MAG: hypothetical protein LH615_14870, partial [Ferruginibacter sp.]|nr:hypothetical protein [Ferruginibacter sp.]